MKKTLIGYYLRRRVINQKLKSKNSELQKTVDLLMQRVDLGQSQNLKLELKLRQLQKSLQASSIENKADVS